MKPERNTKIAPPLDAEALERLALHYVGRYATTEAKLRTYLRRKLRERGWDGAGPPAVEQLAARLTELGYVDDEAFAAGKAAALQRRGYGERRIAEALRAAGIEEEVRARTGDDVRGGALAAALRFAERKRIGPFASTRPDREGRQKQIGAMLRAGHPAPLVRRIVDAGPGEIPELDDD